ncbi:hypothetical protein PRIPAC_71807 [Pristionchus pacificus]|uniref:Uncharacterized protein n=1 Tax=Pristionchus pacificus TaxID=54126 RepID=A0A2A6CT74_PRIPA|nr:hypothetical protein PRIPAC_71807 [Pristionchus pacificus]|eukprot:PDM81339.1 hypothetical protein PRIPAC_36342 [Pristionchus pacificus]
MARVCGVGDGIDEDTHVLDESSSPLPTMGKEPFWLIEFGRFEPDRRRPVLSRLASVPRSVGSPPSPSSLHLEEGRKDLDRIAADLRSTDAPLSGSTRARMARAVSSPSRDARTSTGSLPIDRRSR